MGKNHYIIPIFVPHEGCPHNCVFCNQNSITGSSKKVDINYVINTVEEYLNTINNKDAIIELSFYGGSFTAIDINKQNEFLKIAKKYKDEGKIDKIHMSTRPDYINEFILDNLKKYSVDIIELGVQSLDEEVLNKSGRGHSKEDVIKASNLIKEYGFTLGHQIMLGLPGDNFNKDIKTVEEIIKIKPEIARIYPALVIKNTPMEEMYKSGKYKPYTLDETIHISKKIYGMMVSNDINVIRIGLQPTEEINIGKDLVAGPFHPSIREIIEGCIYNDIIRDYLDKNKTKELIIYVNPKDISKIYTNGKKIFYDTIRLFSNINIKILQTEQVEKSFILFKNNENIRKISFYNYLENNYKKRI